VKRETSIAVADLVKLPADAISAIASASCCIVKEDVPSGSRYTAVIEAPLGRRALMDVLYALAPYKAHGPDRFGRVLDNWGIFDRAKTGGGASSNLFEQHVRSLGNHWRAFEAHRHAFVSTFEDTTEGYRVVPYVAWETGPDGRRRWLLEETLELPASLGHPDSLVGLVTLVYLQPSLARGWPAWKPLVKGGKSNYIGPASVPMMALLHRRAILNSGFVHAVEALDLK
jgi:hypothetical protein